MELKEIRTQLERLKGQQSQIEKDIKKGQKTIKKKTKKLHQYEQAKEIIREVGIKTQQQLQFHISDITSLALEAVFPDPYKLEIEFIQRRNKTECDIYFVRNENKTDPLSASGGGSVDVAAFALRIASWSLARPHSRNTIILDEPFKHLKGVEANKKAIQMLKTISHKLNIQIIMISDERMPMEDIEGGADRIFHTSIKNGISNVKYK